MSRTVIPRANRAFLQRAVRFLVGEAGVRQIIDVGTGIPSAGNVHQVAGLIAPETRVAYVDNDPIVHVHANALLTDTGTTSITVNGTTKDRSSPTISKYIKSEASTRPTPRFLNVSCIRAYSPLSEIFAPSCIAFLHRSVEGHVPLNALFGSSASVSFSVTRENSGRTKVVNSSRYSLAGQRWLPVPLNSNQLLLNVTLTGRGMRWRALSVTILPRYFCRDLSSNPCSR